MYVSEDKFDFLERWMEKATDYDLNDLSGCFDAFFTAYVPFNFIYYFIAHNSTHNLDKKEIPVKIPRRFLGSEAIASDSEIKESAIEIQKFAEKGLLDLKTIEWDKKQIKKLSSNDPEQFSSGALEIIYGIRCNLFHGEKPIEERQQRILIPCIKIIRRLNDLMVTKLRADQT